MPARAAILAIAVACLASAADRYAVTGIILRVDRPHRTFVASCSAIPGYMQAMSMPYSVRHDSDLAGVQPGAYVDFTLVVDKNDSYAEGIHAHHFESMDQEPLLVRRLELLEANPLSLRPGQTVPDFALTDQAGNAVRFSQFSGKVVAITFLYTGCPLPNYCFRLSNNFGRINRRFAGQMGRDLVLLNITFDPVHDQPKVLARYAATWNADPKTWHFLTGPLADVKTACRKLGVNFWQDEDFLTHPLHTLVVDRQGRLAADFEGNEFTAGQLGDFVAAVMARP